MTKIKHSRVWEAGVLNAANYYESLLASATIELPAAGTLIAPAGFRPARDFHGRDNNHYPMHPHYLEVGLLGIAAEAEQSALSQYGEARILLESVARTYRASAAYMERFAAAAEVAVAATDVEHEQARLGKIAQVCHALATRAPETFHEAVQLFLFCWRIRSHQKMATIGRLDQYLISFYQKDIEAGILTEEIALELLVELWRCINTYGSGDTLTNVMLGGVDADGKDATNALSCLMLRASLITKTTEPQMNCRVHKNSPAEYFDLMVQLQLLGHGQASLFNDEVIIPWLVKNGFSVADARNYSNDGCSEIIIDAGCTIDFFQMEAVKTMELTLFEGNENLRSPVAMGQYWSKNSKARPISTGTFLGYSSGAMEEIKNYEDFYVAYLEQYRFQLLGKIEAFNDRIISANRTQIPSLFLLGSFPCFLANGEDIHSSDKIAHIHSIFLGSIPTVADCLAAVKKVVFDEKFCTLSELIRALRVDFDGYDVLRARLLAAPKFGNDKDEVDLIASRLSNDILDMIDEYNASAEIKYLPCLYNYLFNDYAKCVGATPDGRKYGDLICEHYSPTPGRAKSGPTAIIRSAAKTDVARGVGASPLYLSLSRGLLKGTDGGALILSALLRTSIELGLQIVNVAIYDADALRAAQADPLAHEDIIVRVWGYSARFVDLSIDMQNHVIARIANEG